MIEFLIACSPRLDGGLSICPGPNIEVGLCKGGICPSLTRSPIVKDDPEFSPYSTFYKIPLFRYEWN